PSLIRTTRDTTVHYEFATGAGSYSAIDELLHFTDRRALGQPYEQHLSYATDGTRRLRSSVDDRSGASFAWKYDVFGNQVEEIGNPVRESEPCNYASARSYAP